MLNPSSFSPPPFHSCSPLIMPIEEEPEPEPPTSDHILDWLEDSISFPFLNDPYTAAADDDGINSYNQWWDQQDDEDNLINASSINSSPPNPSPPQPESSKKRKPPNNATAKKQSSGKTNGNHSSSGGGGGGGGNKDARWAEQLLNPCASAIGAGNLSRVRHFLYVLHELASLSGDANHRLTAHGLHALTNHLSSSGSVSVPGVSIGRPPTFATTEPRLFQNSLIKFHELSPWFSFPNSLANASILQTLTTLDPSHQQSSSSSRRQRNLHIVDIGVSHGIQWPTLLESLANRPGGPPPLVRLTVVAAAGTPASFSSGPPGDDYPSRLLRFAKRNNLNLQIDRVESHPLQTLTAEALGVASRGEGEETLIICAQFRLHQLPHEDPDDRTEFLRRMRDLEPDLMVLTENDGDCSCSCCCGDFALGFPRRVEFAWKLLDSTSAAFKGRECEERRVIEGEAATALSSAAEMNEGKAGWCERMRGLGFIGEGFGEEAVEGGRTLLRKYDGNWEMRAEEKGRQGCICLCWKGKPVSFCSLWKLPSNKG